MWDDTCVASGDEEVEEEEEEEGRTENVRLD